MQVQSLSQTNIIILTHTFDTLYCYISSVLRLCFPYILHYWILSLNINYTISHPAHLRLIKLEKN